MSQNWFPGQPGQYGQQQQWGNQQQGWMQGGQWVGQPHPQQQEGFYGSQQQFQAGFQQGAGQFPQQHFQTQSFGQPQQPQPQPQPQPQAFGSQEAFGQGQQLPFGQQQFSQPAAQPQQQQQLLGLQQQRGGGGGGGGGGQFLSQQAYAQEHERRVREEKRKRELEQQKKKLQSLSVTSKQSVNLDDLFVKQLPEVPRAQPHGVQPKPPPPHASDEGGATEQSVYGVVVSVENDGRMDVAVETTVTEQPPNTAQTFQKLMAESLDITGSGKPKKVQFKPSAFKQQTNQGESVKPSQSSKARSWGSDDFTGVFAQHQQDQPLQEGDNFGDFQSSEQTGGGAGFAASNEQLQTGHASNHSQAVSGGVGSHVTLPGSHMTQPGGHMMQPGSHMTQSGSHMSLPGSHMMQSGGHMLQSDSHMMQSGSHMIATSAYQSPLSSTNVLVGMQGQAPTSPTKHNTADVVTGHSHLHQASNSTPHNSVLGSNAPQLANSGPPRLSGSPAPQPCPQSPPATGADMSHFHPVYHKVYRLCRKPGEERVSTDLLYPVLLSSKLSRVQLRDLWSLANRGNPGQLNKMELFVLLGLVALAQEGKENPSLEDLKKTSVMPIPTLPALSTLSPPVSHTTDHPLSSVTHNPITEAFTHFHSSTSQPPLAPQATSTTIPAPLNSHLVSAPVQPLPRANSARPEWQPVQPVVSLMQPQAANMQNTATAADRFAAFGELQQNSEVSTIPDFATPTTSANSTNLSSTNVAIRNVSGTDATHLSTPTPPSQSTSQAKGTYSAFDGLRPSQNKSYPQPQMPIVPDTLNAAGHQGQRQGVEKPLGPLENSQGTPQPLQSSQILEPPETIPPLSTPSIASNVVRSWNNTSPSISPSPTPFVPDQVLPSSRSLLPDKSGATSVQHGQKKSEDDDFGDFAQFSSTLTSNTSSSTMQDLASPFYPPTSSIDPAEGTGTMAILSSNEQETGGWADFGNFSTAPVQFSINTPEISTQQPNNVERLQNSCSQAPAESSTAKSRGFEFQRPGAQGNVPTIDGMEKELLSKLTPTLPRKQLQEQGRESLSEAGDQKSEQKAEKRASHSPKPVAVVAVREEEEWSVCLKKCGEVLGTCVEVLKEVEEKELLKEIAQSQEAHSKLHGIAEVYRFAKRIYATLHAKHPITAGSKAEDVRKNWQELNTLLPDNTMENIYSSTRPLPPTDEAVPDVLSDTISQCAICLMSRTVSIASSLSLDGHPEEYSIKLLFHNGQSYHAPCANFWRHFVSEDVPVLG